MTLKIFRVDADCLYNEGCDCDVPMERWEGMARVILAADVDKVVEDNAKLKADLARALAELEKANNPTWTEEQKNDSHDRMRRMDLL